ncbi:MAG: class I SAM-dependent methyltransferase [Caulobacteraceae bacterium]|nr:MAG: class I SAM-dependent methyltransferase [Caulobacteraceae bacterium]
MSSEILAIKDWRHPFPVEGLQLTRPWYGSWHPWRLSVDQPLIKQLVGDLKGKRVLDVACNDAWYAFRYAQEGADAVGIDGRAEPIARGSLVKEHFGLDNLKLMVGDIEDRTIPLGQFDVTLFYGILYHLADPITVLKRLGDITTKVISVQTFIHALDPSPELKLVREAVEEEANGLTNLVTVPTQAAVADMLEFAGFNRVYRILPSNYDLARQNNSNPAEQWAFFLGIKGDQTLSGPGIHEITRSSPPLNQFGLASQLAARAKRMIKRLTGKV